jgi:hypothetical protein
MSEAGPEAIMPLRQAGAVRQAWPGARMARPSCPSPGFPAAISVSSCPPGAGRAEALRGATPGEALVSALGQVIRPDQVLPFARGGIVDAPTLFPLRDGTGLMGEAGPEAIMPLDAAPGGGLGVRARDEDGETVLPLARLPGGDLGVELPDAHRRIAAEALAEAADPFAMGGVISRAAFDPGLPPVHPLLDGAPGTSGADPRQPPQLPPPVIIQIINQGPPLEAVETRETIRPDGAREITLIVQGIVDDGLARGRFDGVLDRRFDLKKRPR